MNTITLPDQLELPHSLSVAIHDYKSTQYISKQQIILSKNTFSFLREGTKEVFFDDSSYSIDNTQFLMMKSGHCLMSEKLSNENKIYRSILLFFSNQAVFEFIRKYELSKPSDGKHYSTYLFDYDLFTRRFADSLLDISKFSESVQINMLNIKFEEIMLYLVELKGVSFIYSLIRDNDNESLKLVQTVETNKLKILSIKQLSFLCNMSVSKFKREFEKRYKTPPIKWFTNKRLEYSAYLLKEERRLASDIYNEIGYENLSNFIQAFKLRYGVTPKQYQTN
ncbi:MAG: helix-turn-helix transcriptional regulator [Flavobacteriaceae bacterium]|nr:helix-turn-helix transcriptional regulator [Flavobacteriaceae bacterium]